MVLNTKNVFTQAQRVFEIRILEWLKISTLRDVALG